MNELIELMKRLFKDNVHTEQTYNGIHINTEEFFEKLKPLLRDKLKSGHYQKSNLEWEENPPVNRMSFEEAEKYADSLTTMSEDGWRLPTRMELLDAWDNGVEGFQLQCYWSSSTFAGTYTQNDSAWSVYFDSGGSGHVLKTNTYYVRLVREMK